MTTILLKVIIFTLKCFWYFSQLHLRFSDEKVILSLLHVFTIISLRLSNMPRPLRIERCCALNIFRTPPMNLVRVSEELRILQYDTFANCLLRATPWCVHLLGLRNTMNRVTFFISIRYRALQHFIRPAPSEAFCIKQRAASSIRKNFASIFIYIQEPLSDVRLAAGVCRTI